MESIPDLSHPYSPKSWFPRRTKPKLPPDLSRLWRTIALQQPDPLVRLRLEWVLHLRESGCLTRTAQHFGLSRKCLHKWQKRFEVRGVAGLVNLSRAPHSVRAWTLPPDVRAKIAALKRTYPVWGRDKLKVLYERESGESISEWQIQRVIKDRGLQWVRPKPKPKKRKRPVRPRIQGLDQRTTPLDALIHADSVELRYGDGSKRYIFTNLEHVSRESFGLVSTTKHPRHAAALFAVTCQTRPGVCHLHSDNGTDHQGELDDQLPGGITHWVSRPHTPKDNPRLERFHRTMQEECFGDLSVTPSLPEMQARLDSWLAVYNTVRPHQALGNVTPAEYREQYAPPK